jgi:hypothetical protein
MTEPKPDPETLKAMIERLNDVAVAARTYYDCYCQDEADHPDFCGAGDDQHRDAKALRDALKGYAGDEVAHTLQALARPSPSPGDKELRAFIEAEADDVAADMGAWCQEGGGAYPKEMIDRRDRANRMLASLAAPSGAPSPSPGEHEALIAEVSKFARDIAHPFYGGKDKLVTQTVEAIQTLIRERDEARAALSRTPGSMEGEALVQRAFGAMHDDARMSVASAKSILRETLAQTAPPASGAAGDGAEAYNKLFDAANEAGMEVFDAGWKCGWMFARFDGCWDDDAEEAFKREFDSVAVGEAWDAHRNQFFKRLPLAALSTPQPEPEGKA